jgi:NAD(P)-dependent dehydrogenase (short-subunit alcohol dehydrogenase family)
MGAAMIHPHWKRRARWQRVLIFGGTSRIGLAAVRQAKAAGASARSIVNRALRGSGTTAAGKAGQGSSAAATRSRCDGAGSKAHSSD